MSSPEPPGRKRVPSAHRLRAQRPERRRHPRIGDCPPLHVRGLRATVHDISRSGISLVLDETVEVGDRCRLGLEDAMDGSVQEIEAEVVWCRERRAGLAWVSLSSEQDRWLFHRFLAWASALEDASRR